MRRRQLLQVVFGVTALSPLIAILTLMFMAREIERLFRVEAGATNYYELSLWIMTAGLVFMTVAPSVALITARVSKYRLERRGVLGWLAVWCAGLLGLFLFTRA